MQRLLACVRVYEVRHDLGRVPYVKMDQDAGGVENKFILCSELEGIVGLGTKEERPAAGCSFVLTPGDTMSVFYL